MAQATLVNLRSSVAVFTERSGIQVGVQIMRVLLLILLMCPPSCLLIESLPSQEP